MRALNSRRPRSITSTHRLVSRTVLCLFLLLCVLHDARARSVPHDDDGVATDQVHGKISEPVEVSDTNSGGVNKETENADRARSLTEEEYNEDDGRKIPAKEISIDDSEKIQAEADEGSVAKKRRRNDVTLSGKSVLQESEGLARDNVAGKVQKDEGIRRFDAQVESDDIKDLGQRKVLDITEDVSASQEGDSDEEKRVIVTDVKPVNEDETKLEKKKDAEVTSDVSENLKTTANVEEAEKSDLNKEETGQVEKLEEHYSDESRIENTEEVRNDLRSLKLADEAESERNQKEHVADDASNAEEIEDANLNRENRHLTSGKSKSSTVYLNAEEGNLPGRGQESIVDGQIKKLISIRDDALESVESGAKQSEKSMDIDIVGETDKKFRNLRSSNDALTPNENLNQPETVPNRFQKWKNQAALLQEQIKNRTFLQYVREQAIEVLPDIPKFTEIQLLETIKNIAQTRAKPSQNETHSAGLNATELNTNQLEIIKCAEQLVETKQRQSFISNMSECIRSLSVLNCMRIFVWPVVLDNLPQPVRDSLNNLPIEINLIDLFQGNRAKSVRFDGDAHRARLLTPESVVFNILRNALESKTGYDQTPTFIDPKNKTLKGLLTIGQLQILQMAEKLLPGDARRDYSDRMFSCVRRFEYFSCVKYFAWPMIKQHYPALPPFPDYQSWYPMIQYYPQYPIVPFPSYAGSSAELPEVVDADATRMRKPEAVIVDILQNTLREHAKVPPPSVTYNTDSYVALLPPEQLLSIHMAEQFLPVQYRSEFVQKTVKCIQDLNYLTCIRYSTWPTVRQFSPFVPNITEWLPNFSDWQFSNWQISDIFSYLPQFQFSSLPDVFSFIPSFGGGGGTSPAAESDAGGSASTEKPSGRIPAILFRQSEPSSKASGELENKITEILTNARNSLRAKSENSPIANENIIVLTPITEKQLNILKLAESLVPSEARAPLVTQVLSCLRANNDFYNCTRYIIWPTVALYVPNFPEFPNLPSNHSESPKPEETSLLKNTSSSQQQPAKDQTKDKTNAINENAATNVKIISRTKIPQSNGPVISVTGTSFVPIFTEHPETVILNILRSIHLSAPSVQDNQVLSNSKKQEFSDLLSDRQASIVKLAENLLPDARRPAFVNRMLQCVLNNNFLTCSRDVLWPNLSDYYPRLPSFPNFGANPLSSNSKPAVVQNLTDPSPFSETNVKIGQHGDATVTITDTRFFPIFTEHPEGVILNILRAVQHATPSRVLNTMIISRSPEIMSYFTEQQANIVQIAESLLPESVRPVFVERMVTCVRESTFLECTRDITWPTIAQFFPRLPNFPNFGSYQSTPRMKIDLASILLRNAYPENQTSNEKAENTLKTAVETIEEKIENALKNLPNENPTLRVENSYLDVNNPAISSLLTAREMNIVRLTEKAIPDTIRRAYVTNMLECMRSNNFITCTQHVSWPTLRQFFPSVPTFDDVAGQIPGGGQIPGIPGISQIPGGGQIPGIPGISQIPGGGQFPGASQISDIIGQFPGGGQFPGASQISGIIGQFPGGGQIPGTSPIPGSDFAGPIFTNPFADGPNIPSFPISSPPQITIPGGQFPFQPSIPQFPSIGFPSFGSYQPQFSILSTAPQQLKPFKSKESQQETIQSRVAHTEETNRINGLSRAANTPSVEKGTPHIVPGYLGQPTNIFIDISKEKVLLSDIERKQDPSSKPGPSDSSLKAHKRRRRSTKEDLLNSYYETNDEIERASEKTTTGTMFPNITETEFLQLLVNISKSKKQMEKRPAENSKEYFVDTLNSTVKNSLTADQYEILKLVEDLDKRVTTRGFLSQVINCLLSLSFIKCMGIFIWPLIINNVPSLIPSNLGILGRSTEAEVQHYFGMSTSDFERELLTRKESVEHLFLDWYQKLMEDKFQADIGSLRIRGYGNGEVGISLGEYREGRATKIKDNKNLPSILTIISDIMEEVLDQRPDNEKIKKEKEKRERSLDDTQEADFQFLKESDEYAEIKRSMNDEQIIAMFLDKIKANATDFAQGDVTKFFNVEDAYNAFSVLFGSRLNKKFMSRFKVFTEENLRKRTENHANEQSTEELKVIPLKTQMIYDREKESVESHQEREREHRAKNEFRSLLDKYSDMLVKGISMRKIEDPDNEIKMNDTESSSKKSKHLELRIYLPRLQEDITSRKITSEMVHLGRALKMKMSNMMPGIGFIITFLIQMALAHARAAASMAGMISNMALASAMFGMIRQSLLGPDNPKIKYVYDNDKTGPGITWPHNPHYDSYYHGK